MHRRSISICVAVTVLALLACKRSAPEGNAASTAADGGDGLTLAKARRLERGKRVSLVLPCKGKLYIGPFRFDKDPQTLVVDAVTRSGMGQQCIGGHWVNGKDEFVAVSGLGCPEGDTPATSALEHTYSPGNGGSDANPVYLRIETELPNDCKPPQVVFTLR